MTLQEIFHGESKTIEFKVELPQKSEKYLKTVVAFSNGSGGKIIIGIDDQTRSIVGVDEKTVFEIMDKIANAISDSCFPQIIPDITFQTIENRCIVIVEIYPGANRPYYLKNYGKETGTYIRIGGTSRPADPVKIKELEMEGMNLSWDELICVGFSATKDQIQKLCKDITQYRSESAVSEEEKKAVKTITADQLINWKILKKTDGKLFATNAFVLLCSNYFSFSKIQCALFKGNERDIFIDKKEYDGPLYEQIESAYQFVLRHINLGAKIDGIIRQDSYELPTGAIREMIVNAVCHRNYMDNSCVQVAVYDNRVEVTSPGMLFGGLTLEEALSGRSKIRNKVIAEVFSRMEIVESWGTGIQRIINRSKEYGLPEPEFQEVGDMFRVNLYRKHQDNSVNQKTLFDKTDRRPIETDKKPINIFMEPLIPDRERTILERENQILAYIQANGSIVNSSARELLGLADSTTKRILKSMVTKGILAETGEKKARRYYLAKPENENL